jgi:hypothetical protein
MRYWDSRIAGRALLLLGLFGASHDASARQSGAPAAPSPAAQSSDASLLASIAGEYEAGSVTIVVTAQPDGTLTLLMPGQPLYHLQQQVELHYFIKELPAFAVEFARDASGAVTQMQVIQPPPQQNFVAVRKKIQQAAATQPMLTPTQIASLAGEYEAGSVTIVVTAQPDGTLTLLMPGQPLYHLQQQVELHYFIKELPAFAVEFARDASGAVTQMQVIQPPPQQNFVAVRKKKQ